MNELNEKMAEETNGNAVRQHYEREGLTARIAAALEATGVGTGRLSSADLAPLDQFHSRGLLATVELAAAVPIGPRDHVLDIGSGLGGPSRYLAETFGCQVRGVDLSESYVEAATYLAERTGLAARVGYVRGSALALPCDSESHDVVWTQHAAMNISDRAGLYAEAFRVLKPGGRMAIYDVVAGAGGPAHFPVPWATEPEGSFLLTQEEMRGILERQGFRVVSWIDHTEEGIVWFGELLRKQAQSGGKPPVLGLHLVLGANASTMVANLARNLNEGRVGLVQAVLERPVA